MPDRGSFVTIASRMIDKEAKTKVISQMQQHKKDTGSPEVQIGIMTKRIQELTEHLKTHKKDRHSRRGLLQLVSKRKKLLEYLQRKDFSIYTKVIRKLEIRR